MKPIKSSLPLRILGFLGIAIAIILFAIFAIPVALLPGTTAVPAYLWIPLWVIGIALVILVFILKPVGKGLVVAMSGILILSFFAVLLSQAFAMTPPITDASGEPIPGSIASLEKISLNGTEQWISIRGKDTNKPVLLFLAGGPGGSQLTTARFALQGLEDHFVVVNWEQPGAGKSFDVKGRKSLTVDRYIEDAHDLIMQIRERFGQEKVYVLGESWGSALGIMLVQRFPELFHAFIGTGQMVAFLETDLECYDFAMQLAQSKGDMAKVDKLVKQGPPPYYGMDVAMLQVTYLMDTYSYMNGNPAIRDNGTNTFRDLAAPEYGLYDKVNWARGVLDTLGIVYPQLWKIDFRESATKLDVPVYFLIGRHDVNAPVHLTEEYFNLLDAPQKQIVWFESSGHTPWVSESDRFVQVMVDTVLAQTQP